jgi:hypothetical protein
VDWYSDRHPSSQLVSIFASEAKAIARLAEKWGETETGGELYGLWSHAGRPVVMLATSPGPKAIHEATYFRQDVERFREVTEYLNRYFGLQLIGDYHSHHKLGLNKPSPGDATQVASIATKNHLPRFVQFIITLEDEAPPLRKFTEKEPSAQRSSTNCPAYPRPSMNTDPRKRHHAWGPFPRQPTSRQVVLNSFFYSNASSGQYTRCPLRIIPGLSPFRMALLHSGLLEDVASDYPTDHIVYEQWDSPEQKRPSATEIPEEVLKQIQGLPDKTLDELSATTHEEFFAIHLILPDKSTLSVVYLWQKPHPIRAVFIVNGSGQGAEVTDDALIHGRHTKLSEIYQRMTLLAEDNQRLDEHPVESREKSKTNSVIDRGISKKDAEPV